MNEGELIARLIRDLPSDERVIVGPGDDCAVLEVGLRDDWLLFKTDAVVAGRHFATDAAPEQVGHKVLARNLSDLAAMAGEPLSAVVTIALPPSLPTAWIEAVYAGLRATAARFKVSVVGGETVGTDGPAVLSVALLGQVAKQRCVRRDGARPGEAIFVTGELGGSLAGKHLDFVPRLTEARWLAAHFRPTAMIDLSDGLATDLRHLLRASGVGAELRRSAIPISRAARLRARSGAGPAAFHAALSDGEDFELCFTVASESAVRLHDAWKEAFPELKLSCVGRVLPTPELTIRDAHGLHVLKAHGYDHFPQPG